MIEVLPEVPLGMVDVGIFGQGDVGVPHGPRGFSDMERAHGLVALVGGHPDLLVLIEFIAGYNSGFPTPAR